MEEIKVGEYVRTKNKGIKKIAYLRPNTTVNKYAYFIGYDDDGDRLNGILKTTDIIKHSRNIIDLIEVGDILKLKNGEKWEVQEHQGDGNWLQLEWENIDDNEDFFKKVDSIITKEQFEENSYEVGD